MITRKIHRSKKLSQKYMIKMIKNEIIIYIDGSVNAAVEHCKTYIITFRGSKTKFKCIYLIRHIDVTEKIITYSCKKKITLFSDWRTKFGNSVGFVGL